jgi:hypothetical protein
MKTLILALLLSVSLWGQQNSPFNRYADPKPVASTPIVVEKPKTVWDNLDLTKERVWVNPKTFFPERVSIPQELKNFCPGREGSTTENDLDVQVKLEVLTKLKGIFPVDNAVDIWCWDANKVNNLRKIYGYTWIPNAFMENITIAPGLSSASLSKYDPGQAPPGSILVPPDSK